MACRFIVSGVNCKVKYVAWTFSFDQHKLEDVVAPLLSLSSDLTKQFSGNTSNSIKIHQDLSLLREKYNAAFVWTYEIFQKITCTNTKLYFKITITFQFNPWSNENCSLQNICQYILVTHLHNCTVLSLMPVVNSVWTFLESITQSLKLRWAAFPQLTLSTSCKNKAEKYIFLSYKQLSKSSRTWEGMTGVSQNANYQIVAAYTHPTTEPICSYHSCTLFLSHSAHCANSSLFIDLFNAL